MKERDPNKDALNVRPKQSVYNDPKHRCAALTTTTESVSNDARGIRTFCWHIMEYPPQTEPFLRPLEGHILLLLLFFPLSLYFSFSSPTSRTFQTMCLVTGLFLSLLKSSWFEVFPQLRFDLTFLPICLINFTLLQTQSSFLSSSRLSSPPPLFSLNQWWTLGHWLSRPGTQEDKGLLTFTRWLGLCLICLCHPFWRNTKAPALRGAPLHPLTPAVTPINQISLFMLLNYDCASPNTTRASPVMLWKRLCFHLHAVSLGRPKLNV